MHLLGQAASKHGDYASGTAVLAPEAGGDALLIFEDPWQAGPPFVLALFAKTPAETPMDGLHQSPRATEKSLPR